MGFCFFFLLSLEQVQMGRSVVISDNDCVNASHMTWLNSEERLNDGDIEGSKGSLMAGSVLPDFRSHLQYVIMFYLTSFWKQSGLFFLLQLCSWSAWYFFLHLFFLELFQKTFGEVNETICNFFYFYFIFFLLGVIQSHLKVIEQSHWLWRAVG